MNGQNWIQQLQKQAKNGGGSFVQSSSSSGGVSNMSSGVISVTVDSETVIVRNSQTGEIITMNINNFGRNVVAMKGWH